MHYISNYSNPILSQLNWSKLTQYLLATTTTAVSDISYEMVLPRRNYVDLVYHAELAYNLVKSCQTMRPRTEY